MLLLVRAARAEDKPRAEDLPHATAHHHSEHARVLVGEFAFRDAIADYRRAFENVPSPDYLYNLGYLHFRLAEQEPPEQSLSDKRAGASYLRRYLAAVPAAPDREIVERWAMKMERDIPVLEESERKEVARRAEEVAMRERERTGLEERVRQAEVTARQAQEERLRTEEKLKQAIAEAAAEKARHKARLRIGLPMMGVGLLATAVGGALTAGSVAVLAIRQGDTMTVDLAVQTSLASYGQSAGLGIPGGLLLGAGVTTFVGGVLVCVMPYGGPFRTLSIAPSSGGAIVQGNF